MYTEDGSWGDNVLCLIVLFTIILVYLEVYIGYLGFSYVCFIYGGIY